MKLLLFPFGIGGGQRVSHYRKRLQFEWTKDPLDSDVTVALFYDKRNRKDYPDELKEAEERGIKVWNKDIVSIKKDHLDNIFTQVFGYSLKVDPTKHRGVCLIRSTQNATKSKGFIECPIPEWRVDKRPRYSGTGEPHYRQYLKMIDTRVSQDVIRDFRIVVMGGEIVFMFEKLIDVKSMFNVAKGAYFEVKAHRNLKPFFSDEEIGKIKEFIKAMHLDFCEIDVLRNNSDGLVYIVDANDIPSGAAYTMLPEELQQYLANQFKELMLC